MSTHEPGQTPGDQPEHQQAGTPQERRETRETVVVTNGDGRSSSVGVVAIVAIVAALIALVWFLVQVVPTGDGEGMEVPDEIDVNIDPGGSDDGGSTDDGGDSGDEG